MRIAETLDTLQELVRVGKVREIGCSNFSLAQLREAEAATPPDRAGFVSVQNELSLLHRIDVDDVLPECAAKRIAYLPFFPLAGGMLTGKYQGEAGATAVGRLATGGRLSERFRAPANVALVDGLTALAEGYGHTLLELAFAWLLSFPAVRVGDRRDDAGAGARQRRGGRVGAGRGGAARDRRAARERGVTRAGARGRGSVESPSRAEEARGLTERRATRGDGYMVSAWRRGWGRGPSTARGRCAAVLAQGERGEGERGGGERGGMERRLGERGGVSGRRRTGGKIRSGSTRAGADEALQYGLEFFDRDLDVLDDAAVEHRGGDAAAALALGLGSCQRMIRSSRVRPSRASGRSAMARS